MKLLALFVAVGAFFIVGVSLFHYTRSSTSEPISTEAEGSLADTLLFQEFTWQRPPGPPRVGLQVGHWKNNELPDELKNLRERGGGTRGGGKAEWEVNLAIAERTAELLRQDGIEVDILPATVPPEYWADVLVAIHADGNENTSVSGFKVAAPRRDRTGKAEDLARSLSQAYAEATKLFEDSAGVTRNMRGYYAFNWRRYEHAMHPMTVAAIVETGFLTNPSDQKILIHQPEQSAAGIAAGIMAYLATQDLS